MAVCTANDVFLISFAVFKSIDNVAKSHISTHDAPEETKNEYQYIFVENPSKFPQVCPICCLRKLADVCANRMEIFKINLAYRVNYCGSHEA